MLDEFTEKKLRRRIADANTLGIACTTGEYMSKTNFTNQVWTPVVTWLNQNPTKRPNYVVLCYDVPSRFILTGIDPVPDVVDPDVVGGLAYELRRRFPSRLPFLTHLNMQTTNDCIAYINKLVAFGSNLPLNRVLISASANGYSNLSFALDNVREGTNFGSGFLVRDARDTLVTLGVATNNLLYADNRAGVYYSDPWPYYTNNLSNATNVAGYIGWGQHAGLAYYWPTNFLKFHGDSSWFLMQSIESWNGLWPAGSIATANQSSFQMWFSSIAFGGTNYSSTPVGAVSHTSELSYPGPNETKIYFGLWQLGKNAAIAGWISNLPGLKVMQATGDPWVAK